jgi:DNA-binding MarR family transcriptional regulator
MYFGIHFLSLEAMMTEQEILDSARNIFMTGRMIHDEVQRITTAACISEGESKLGELSAPQMNMIMMIRVREKVSVKDLASLLGVSPPSVSIMVDRLVEKGLLTRSRCETDRRRVVIQVSSEAIEDITVVEKKVLDAFVKIVEALGPETTRKWCEVLQKIKTILNGNPIAA